LKILIVGSQKKWAIENYYHKYLNQLGHPTDLYPIHDFFYDFYYKNLVNRIWFKISPLSVYKKLNEDFLKFIATTEYHLIWIFKGMEIFPETLKMIKETKVNLVNFNPDHPFYFSGRGSGNDNVYQSIRNYDLHLCYHPGVLDKIVNEYQIPGFQLPFGYEPQTIRMPDENSEIRKACFIGNPDPIRIKLLQQLINWKVPLDLFGNQWQKYIKPDSQTGIYPAVYQEEFMEVAPKYKVQINIFRPHNRGSHNMRTFEMPGAGCIMVAPESKDHCRFFDKDEIGIYNDPKELKILIDNFISMSYDDAIEMRKRALKRSIASGYDYLHRTKSVIEIFKDSFGLI